MIKIKNLLEKNKNDTYKIDGRHTPEIMKQQQRQKKKAL